jgi:flavin reductase (DIM6/NTAB) family NADH-FMN oxidoreductase RutF
LGEFLTGVAVVTSSIGDQPIGMTVNSFTSVSLDPPLVLFCANESSTAGSQILSSGAFAVNILRQEQRAIAERFATPVDDRFTGVRIRKGLTGSPVLLDALAIIECRIVDQIIQGDHTIIVGEVEGADALGHAAPLAFFRGSYAGESGGCPRCGSITSARRGLPPLLAPPCRASSREGGS